MRASVAGPLSRCPAWWRRAQVRRASMTAAVTASGLRSWAQQPGASVDQISGQEPPSYGRRWFSGGWVGRLEFHLSEPAKMVYLFAMSIVPTGASRVADLR